MSLQPTGIQSGNSGNDTSAISLGNLQSVGPTYQQPSMVLPSTTVETPVQSQQIPQTIHSTAHPVKTQQQQQQQQQQQLQHQQLLQSSTNATNDFLTKARLQELVREVDPSEQLDDEVEEMLLQLADDFVETTVNAACLLAKHRHANTVEVKDVQLHLERNWNMWIPGFGTDEVRPYKRASVTEAHKQRLALIRKSVKKY